MLPGLTDLRCKQRQRFPDRRNRQVTAVGLDPSIGMFHSDIDRRHPLPDRLRRELEREYARLALIETQLREVEKERDTADAQDPNVEHKRQMLVALQGVGGTSAAILAREVFARSFASRRQLGSYLGLTPSAYDSGSTTRCQGISKAGNSWARRILIEVAWLWQKYQPASPLSHWYIQRTAGQSSRIRRIMLIALARKLAISLWRYVETALVPDGGAIARPEPRGTPASHHPSSPCCR